MKLKDFMAAMQAIESDRKFDWYVWMSTKIAGAIKVLSANEQL